MNYDDEEDYYDYWDEMREALKEAGTCTGCGDVSGFNCICETDEGEPKTEYYIGFDKREEYEPHQLGVEIKSIVILWLKVTLILRFKTLM